MNDARHPAVGTRSRCPEHIYAHLHGTGGIGPGTWRRQGLAEAQEAAARDKYERALYIVRVVLSWACNKNLDRSTIAHKVVTLI